MSNESMREEHYIVFKMSDLGNSLKGDEIRRLAREYAEHRQRLHKKPLECVVVEKDWPEYEPTWRAIEARATGAQPAPTERSITTGTLSEMFLSLDGHDKAHPGYDWRKGWNDAIRQAMDYAQPAPSVPTGWKLVPIEPTPEMMCALIDGANQYDSWTEGYRDMLAAAPEAKP